MKIHRHGIVILTEGPIRIEGWNVEREAEDPPEATDGQLLLGYAIHWAQERMRIELNKATFDVFRKIAGQKKAEAGTN